MKRQNDEEVHNSSTESPEKKRKLTKYKLINKFNCSYFYIDKSLLIKKFIDDEATIFCITGPSSGKSINLYMMNYFFKMNYENENVSKNREFFEELNIAKEFKYGESYIDLYQGKYPVVYLNFNTFRIGKDYNDTIDNFKRFIRELYEYYKDIDITNLEDDKKIWKSFQEHNDDFKKFIEKKIVLLIDNYDSPILNALNKNFYDEFYTFYINVFKNIFENNDKYNYLFKIFITGKINIELFSEFKSRNYSTFDSEYIEYYSITNFELKKISDKLKLKNKSEMFEKFYNNIESTLSSLNSTDISNTNKINKINILISPTLSNNNADNDKDDDYDYDSNKVKYYDISCLSDCIKMILSEESYNNLFLKEEEFFNEVFNHREIIWSLFIEYGYLIAINTENENNKKLIIRNKVIEELIKDKFIEWKNNLYYKNKEVINGINYFIKYYDEERIKEFLESKINIDNFNEKYNIRELLFVNKKYQNDNVDYETSSEIFYFIMKEKLKNVEFNKSCYEALDNNEELIFNGKSLNKKNEKIIKYGIAIYKEECDVIYEINYGEKFKRKEMPKKVYSGEAYMDVDEFYFVDKTRMIQTFINNDRNVYLIVRPRRFGKSLNLSMIKEFFEKPVNREKLRNKLFDGLEVSKNRKNMREFHKYPVLYLNFKNDYSNNYESAIEHLKNEISNLFQYQREKIDFEILDKNEQTKWKEIEYQKEDETGLTESVRFLCECLKKFYKRKCIILIDEYDKTLINSFEKGFYDDMHKVIKSLFSNTFKRNERLYFGITTGCLALGLSSIFSGINKFSECSLLNDPYFGDCYGFNENELNKILSAFNIHNQNDKIQKKYNGYTCKTNGKEIIKNLYNPFSLMQDCVYRDYWYKTGGVYNMEKTFKDYELPFSKDFLSLLYGNIIILNVPNEFVFKNKYNKDEILLLLLYSGYLTLSDEKDYKKNINNMDDQMTKLLLDKVEVNNLSLDEPKSTEKDESLNQIKIYKNSMLNQIIGNNKKYVKVTNGEILENLIYLLQPIIEDKLEIASDDTIDNFIRGLIGYDVENVYKNINEYLKKLTIYYLNHMHGEFKIYENVYQILLMHIFLFFKCNDLTTEENSGYGRYDFGFPIKNCYNNREKEYVLIEVRIFKKNTKCNEEINNEEEEKEDHNYIKTCLLKECEDAIKQIENKNYEEKYRANGYNSFTKYGIALYKRTCEVKMKINDGEIESSSSAGKKRRL
ncbi:hypothetical protein BCR36DRAFT_394700 [Piromyces finnis]|uniref:AAA-ATPase-like domain-containing protein n=1 Tax=Piromyces finnis TaxID=1754191 RepID=A0A1Y1VL56_9FUNG|nr:hypothetical protein BCR36DRAFT_394700 [Piromyces finnis]|eukprot:ORX59180.1 hypothetical protein BCR36DRAFT_394700 [Piromyces finnis]